LQDNCGTVPGHGVGGDEDLAGPRNDRVGGGAAAAEIVGSDGGSGLVVGTKDDSTC